MGIKYNVVGVCQEVVEHGVQPAWPGTGSIIPGDIVIARTVGRGYMADRDGIICWRKYINNSHLYDNKRNWEDKFRSKFRFPPQIVLQTVFKSFFNLSLFSYLRRKTYQNIYFIMVTWPINWFSYFYQRYNLLFSNCLIVSVFIYLWVLDQVDNKTNTMLLIEILNLAHQCYTRWPW